MGGKAKGGRPALDKDISSDAAKEELTASIHKCRQLLEATAAMATVGGEALVDAAAVEKVRLKAAEAQTKLGASTAAEKKAEADLEVEALIGEVAARIAEEEAVVAEEVGIRIVLVHLQPQILRTVTSK